MQYAYIVTIIPKGNPTLRSSIILFSPSEEDEQAMQSAALLQHPDHVILSAKRAYWLDGRIH